MKYGNIPNLFRSYNMTSFQAFLALRLGIGRKGYIAGFFHVALLYDHITMVSEDILPGEAIDHHKGS